MAKNFSYRALIQGLENLYSQIALHLLHKRINTYHSKASDGKRKYHEGIKTPLMDFIETTVVQAVKTNNPEKNDEPTIEVAAQSYQQAAHPHRHRSINQEHIDDLSRYFKARSKDSDLHPAIQDKLEHSVWEHIHATIRCARQGDKRNAKMHLNIASTACKELGHYMKEEEYQAFVKKAEEHMGTLAPKNKHT